MATTTGDKLLTPPVVPEVVARRASSDGASASDPIRSFALTLLMVAADGGLPGADRPVGHDLDQEPVAAVAAPTRRSGPPSQRCSTTRARTTTSTRCRSTARCAALALYKPGRPASDFIDPANPDAGPIHWLGSWRTLEPAWQFAPHFENYAHVWDLIDFPRLLFNTVGHRAARHARHARLVHAGGLRLRPLPLPRPVVPVHAS